MRPLFFVQNGSSGSIWVRETPFTSSSKANGSLRPELIKESLNLQVSITINAFPLVEFLKNRAKGHCLQFLHDGQQRFLGPSKVIFGRDAVKVSFYCWKHKRKSSFQLPCPLHQGFMILALVSFPECCYLVHFLYFRALTISLDRKSVV